ncbi:MAG: hypothetical protein M5U30_06990 [Burkholderiaceae bacterium]|nr:hypothetical protein [Burkholderiaceae bacterium]
MSPLISTRNSGPTVKSHDEENFGKPARMPAVKVLPNSVLNTPQELLASVAAAGSNAAISPGTLSEALAWPARQETAASSTARARADRAHVIDVLPVVIPFSLPARRCHESSGV